LLGGDRNYTFVQQGADDARSPRRPEDVQTPVTDGRAGFLGFWAVRFCLLRSGQPAVIPSRRAARKVAMRFGNTEVRFLGGPMGCLVMLLLSVLVSVVLTVVVNLVL
jgi:hypothetical protein